MRILLCLLLFLLLGLNFTIAQKIVLDELMSTKNEFTSEVFEDGEVVGYLIIYRKEDPVRDSDIKPESGLTALLFSTKNPDANQTINLEYRFLDRNLNLVIEGRFNTLFEGEFISAEIMNNSIFLKKRYTGSLLSKMQTTFFLLPLKLDAVETKELAYINESIVHFDTKMHIEMKNQNTEVRNNQIYRVFKSGQEHLLLAFGNHNTGRLNTGFSVFDMKMERVFQYKIPKTTKGPYSFLMPVGATSSYILFTESHMKSPTSMNKRELLVFSKDSFVLLHRHALEEKGKPHLYQLKFRELDGMLYMSGAYSTFKGNPYYAPFDFIGLYLMVFDKSGAKIIDKHAAWQVLDDRLDIRKSKVTLKPGLGRNFVEDFQVLGVDTIGYIFGLTISPGRISKAEQHNSYFTNIDKHDIVNGFRSSLLSHEFKLHDIGDSISVTKWRDNDAVHFTHFDPEVKQFTMVIEKIPLYLGFKPLTGTPGYIIHVMTSKSSTMSELIPKETETSKYYVLRAKKGYILIAEISKEDNSGSLRLEKIDF